MSNIKTTHREVEITYDEFSNSWNCDLFSKPAETLAAAKARIDKKLDTEKKEPFKRFKAYTPSRSYGETGFRLVEVSSMTDDGKEAWITQNGKREKLGCYGRSFAIYPETPENTAIVEELRGYRTEINKLNQKIEDSAQRLTVWKP